MPFGRTFLIVVAISIPVTAGATEPRNAARDFVIADQACANAAATIISHFEAKQPELQTWIRDCSAHPRPSICRDTADTVRQVTGKPSPFSCASGPDREIPTEEYNRAADDYLREHGAKPSTLPSQPNPNAAADEACGNVAAAIAIGRDPETDWIRLCNADPDQSACKNAADTITTLGKRSPLSCGTRN